MKTHIRFCGAGGHYSYLLGIASILQKYFILDDNVIFSGYSAGCVPALLCCLNIDISNEFLELNIPLLEELQTNKLKSFFNFIPTLKKYLLSRLNIISEDIYLNANNKLNCNLTHIPTFQNHIIDNYQNNEDLVDCILASGHLPIYNNCIFYNYRNNYYVDGGLTQYINGEKSFFNPNYNLIELKRNKWRDLPGNWIFISSCSKYSEYLYELGKLDGLNNIQYFNKYLKLKKRLVRRNSI